MLTSKELQSKYRHTPTDVKDIHLILFKELHGETRVTREFYTVYVEGPVQTILSDHDDTTSFVMLEWNQFNKSLSALMFNSFVLEHGATSVFDFKHSIKTIGELLAAVKSWPTDWNVCAPGM